MSTYESEMTLSALQTVVWNDTAPSGTTLEKVFIGPDPDGLGGFQIATAAVVSAPTRAQLDKLFTLRKGNRAISLVVAATDGTRTWLYGPDPQTPTIELPRAQATRQLQSILDEPDSTAAFNRIASLRQQVDSGGVGWTNNGLFAKYHLEHNVPTRSDWTLRASRAKPLLDLRGQRLIEALGFRSTPGSGGTLILAAAGGESEAPRAVAVLLDESEHFDAKSPRYQLTPIAFGLAVAQRQELPWVIGLRRDHIRLYPGKDGIGVGQKGQVETYFEIDLSSIDDEQSALLTLVFSAEALTKGGTTDELLHDSARYATGLGLRLRQRIYEEVVPPIARAVAGRLPDLGINVNPEGLQMAYKLTLRILFRLLFQAYAEDRGLLPYGRNEGYTANSLKTIAQRNQVVNEADFGDAASIWLGLVQVWNAIDQGNKQWQVPAYNGGLFATDATRSEEGALLARLSLPDSVLGPALQHLLVDETNEGNRGPVDFRALSVREFGTIYEGLLESSLSIANADLTTDRNDAWIPAGPNDDVEAASGTVYFHSASGERKATGSYFTPKVVVDHLIERAIVPALSAHLDIIAARLSRGEAVSRTEFFDFRVADLAMGSGHFLVAAVDKIEALMRTFLTEHDIPDVRQELLSIAGVAREALGTDEVAKSEVDEVGLLRRQVARRCIYGLDINPLAVELARLALWIHTFVPGLPMSNLDHGLVCANSLTGIGTIDEAIDSLVGAPTSYGSLKAPESDDEGLFGELETGRRETGHQLMVRRAVTDYLKESLPLLADVANASEAGKAEVERAAELLAKAKAKALPASRIFDAAIAVRLGKWSVSITKEEHVTRLVETTEPTDIVASLNPAHMPVLFPEVFLRDRPGFDVLLGNPPWEKVQVDERALWALRFPGLRGLPVARQRSAMELHRSERPDVVDEIAREVARTDSLRSALLSGPYPGLGSGHPDLYKAFCWRYWGFVRRQGTVGLVLPRSAVSASGSAAWREAVFKDGTFATLAMLHNTGGWVFEDVHAQDRFALVTVTRGKGQTNLETFGPFNSEAEFVSSERRATLPAAEVQGWGVGSALPWLPSADSADVLRTLVRSPRFVDRRDDFRFRPVQGDFNATTDADSFVFDESGDLPVYKGGSIGLWQPETTTLFATAKSALVLPRLESKRASQIRHARSAFNELSAEDKVDPSKLPVRMPRIVFADITNQSNQRTMVTALVPPLVILTHKAPYLLEIRGDKRDEAFVLGVLSSIPFDWYMRRYVEKTLSFEILGASPVPSRGHTAIADRLIEVTARLAAVDDRFREWADEVGVNVGTAKDDPVKSDLISELDALVSLLYGLTEEQVCHVFETFHRGWDYQARLDTVLAHYSNWKKTA